MFPRILLAAALMGCATPCPTVLEVGGGGSFGQQKFDGVRAPYNEGRVDATLTFDLTIPKGQCPMYGEKLYDFEYE